MTGRHIHRPFLDRYQRRPPLGEPGGGVAEQPQGHPAQDQERAGCEHENGAQPSAT